MNQSTVVLYRPNLASSDEKSLISELVDALAASGAISDAAGFKDAVWEREEQQRTWLGRDTALPHARIPSVNQLALVIANHRTGIPWGGDDKLAHLFFLVAVPPNGGVDYLYLTQRITRALRDDKRRGALLNAANAAALAKAWQADS